MKPLVALFLVIPLFAAVLCAQSVQPSEEQSLTIEQIFADGGLTGRAPESIQWSPDNTALTYLQRDDAGERAELWSVDPATGGKKILVPESKLATLAPPLNRLHDDRERDLLVRYSVAPYLWSPGSKYLLFQPKGQLWLYTISNGTAIQLSEAPEPSRDPKFSPDGKSLAYVRNHNLYVRGLAGNKERPLTRDKDANLLNGEVDWLYAEELTVRSNYFWSPDSRDILFLQMDETHVPTYPLTDWLPTHPKVDMEKYPKAGDPNPAARLGVIHASGGKIKWLSLDKDDGDYIPRLGWVRNGLAWAEVLNRKQDTMDLYFVDTVTGKSRKVLTETDPEGWINVNDNFQVLGTGDHFLWTSWRDGHTHIYLYAFDKENPLAAPANAERQLTHGDFEVLSIDAVDEIAGVVYFSCNMGDPRQQQMYSVKLDGSEVQRLSQEDGVHEPTFAPNSKSYIDNFSAALAPPSLALCRISGACQKMWESRSVANLGLITPRILELKADDGTTLYGQLLLPNGGETPKIPVVVYVYGGPAAQLVRNAWGGTRGLFHQYLAHRGFAIFTVDNRGTPNRDRKFQTAIHHQFGWIELKDQLSALDQVFTQFPQLDRNRVAMWGWSNGASMTLYSLTHSDRFRAGAAVAPVTDWHNYDSAYTERYLGLPQDNPKPYEESSMTRAAEKLQGSLLLAHGTLDDNVHFQNSVQMVEALMKAGKQFRFMLYPNKTHDISGPTDRDHLFHMIEDHFECELK